MRTVFYILILAWTAQLHAICVDEKFVFGAQLGPLTYRYDVMVETSAKLYRPLSQKKTYAPALYKVQLFPKSSSASPIMLGPLFRVPASESNLDPIAHYNQNYIEYYTYGRMRSYLRANEQALDRANYQFGVVGKSLEGRDLFFVGPRQLDPQKKTIVMFGRHHGDEGTANWVIEGFVDAFLSRPSVRSKYQLLLYPMINPDGAMRMSRHNYSGRDLNRAWTSFSGHDEIEHIHKHLRPFLKESKNVLLVLDMHGSWREDFVYRVDADFSGEDFFALQKAFVDELGALDPWQNGKDIISNGDPGMARIVMVSQYGLNALTHETLKNIPLDNPLKRSRAALKKQGADLLRAISRFDHSLTAP